MCCKSLEVLRLEDCNWIDKATLSFIGKHAVKAQLKLYHLLAATHSHVIDHRLKSNMSLDSMSFLNSCVFNQKVDL